MTTDQRTGTRSIGPARETYAAVAILGLTLATVLRALADRPGAIVGIILTVMALAIVSRFRVSWNTVGIAIQTPLGTTRYSWREITAYTLHPQSTSRRNLRLRLQTCRGAVSIPLAPYSLQDASHLTSAISTEVPQHHPAPALVG